MSVQFFTSNYNLPAKAPRQITPWSMQLKKLNKIILGSWHINNQIWMFLLRPALEASLGSYYSLSGFVILRYSKLLNHLVQHVEIVDFKIEKCLLDPLSFFFFFFIFCLDNPVWFTQALLLSVNVDLDGECFAAMAVSPLGQQQGGIGNNPRLSRLWQCRNTELYLRAPLHEQKRSLEWVTVSRLLEGKKVARGGKNDAFAHMQPYRCTQAERVKRALAVSCSWVWEFRHLGLSREMLAGNLLWWKRHNTETSQGLFVGF